MPTIRRIALPLVLAISTTLLATACDARDDRDSADVAAAPVPEAAEISEAPERPEQPERPEIPERDEAPERPESSERSASSKPTFVEGPDGSASITSRNGALVMSLRHDSIVVAFSDSMRAVVQGQVKQSMHEDAKADTGDDSALGQIIKGVVQSTVSGALREVFEKSRGFPVSAVRDVSYDDGAIRFSYVKTPTWNFDKINADHEPLLEQFHPADAARFVGAVRARLNR